jgi:hypothetical protein
MLLFPCSGIQRNWGLRKKTMPFGPQYSNKLEKTSIFMNAL